MSIVNSYLPILAVLIAFLTAVFLSRFDAKHISSVSHSFPTIDGLRGYLAFAVFLHHGVIWHYYVESGEWGAPPSNLYTHFGQDGVTLFFMITGLLFGRKILDGQKKPVDWLRLYISRVLRLTPLYLLAVSALFFIVACMSGFTLHEPLLLLLKKVIRWILFAALGGSPDINGVKDTSLIIAVVTWSLTYEWFFYFALPVIAFILGVKPGKFYLVFGLLSVAVCFWWKPEIYHILTFFIGILVARLSQSDKLKNIARRNLGSVIAIGALVGLVLFNRRAHELTGLPYVFVFFLFIACGNDLFGLLRQRASILLGEVSYGIYLLHGIVLWVTFKLILGVQVAKNLTVFEHWSVLIVCVPVLVGLSYLAFYWIERPSMNLTACTTKYVRKSWVNLFGGEVLSEAEKL